MIQGQLLEVALSVEPVKRLERPALRDAADEVQIGPSLRRPPEAPEGLDGEDRVPQPAEAIVPGALLPDRLGDGGRCGGRGGAGRRRREELQTQGRAQDLGVGEASGLHAGRPGSPGPRRRVEFGLHRGEIRVRRRATPGPRGGTRPAPGARSLHPPGPLRRRGCPPAARPSPTSGTSARRPGARARTPRARSRVADRSTHEAAACPRAAGRGARAPPAPPPGPSAGRQGAKSRTSKAPEADRTSVRRTFVPSKYAASKAASSSAGAKAKEPPSRASSRRPKTEGPSRRGRQSQSIPVSGWTMAVTAPFPITPCGSPRPRSATDIVRTLPRRAGRRGHRAAGARPTGPRRASARG